MNRGGGAIWRRRAAGLVAAAMLGGLAAPCAAELAPGDIAFVAYQSATTNDRFAFLVLADLPPGTVINFTDNGWSNGAARFRLGEGLALWSNNTDAAIGCGTVVTVCLWNSGVAAETSLGSITNQGSLPNLSSAGDSLLAFQGSALSPLFLAGLNTKPWSTNGAANSNESDLPAALAPGVHAILWDGAGDNGFYAGPLVCATRAGLLTAIQHAAAWVRSDSLQSWPAWSFGVAAPAPALAAGDVALIAYQSDANGTDRFAFVCLKPLAPGTELAFTDNAWTGTGLAAAEDTVVWQAPPAGLPAGAVVCVENGLASTGSISAGLLNLNAGGDNLLGFQGLVTNPVFIAGFSAWPWLTNGTPGNAATYRPPGLCDGASALAFAAPVTNACYAGPTQGGLNMLRARICDAAEWVSGSQLQTWPFPARFDVRPQGAVLILR